MRIKVRLGKVQIQLKEEKTAEYENILQTKPTNAITRAYRHNIIEDDYTGIGSANINGIELIVENCKENMITETTKRIFDLIMIKFTEIIPYGEKTPLEVIDEKREININLSDYMEKCGLKNKAEARKQLIKEIDTLYNTSLKWTETRAVSEPGKKRKVMSEKTYYTRIIDTKGTDNGKTIKNSVATVKLTMDLAKYLTFYGYVCPYNMNVLKLPLKTSASPIAKAMLELDNINKENPKRRGKISIKTLLKRTGKMETYKNLNRKSGFSRKIIDTLERDLDELVRKNIIEFWEYAKPNGERYTDEDMGYNENEEYTGEKEIFISKAEDYLNQNIIFKLKNYPETQKKREKNQKIENL